MVTPYEDLELADVASLAAELLRTLARRWRLRIQSGRLGVHPLDETLRLSASLDAAAHLLDGGDDGGRAQAPPRPENEERFRILVDGVTDYAICMIDREGRTVSWNVGAQRIYGYRAEEVLGRTIAMFFPPEAVDAGQPGRDLEAATRDSSFIEEGWRIRKGGERFWATATLTALRDGDGRLRGFAMITRDVTRLREAAEALRQSEERLRVMIEAVRDYAIFTLDPTGNVTSWNLGAERLKGYRADEIIGTNFSVFYLEADRLRDHPAEELRLATENGRYEEEGWRVRKDGTQFWANVVITAVFDSDGRHIGFTKVTRDFTDAKRYREAQLAIQIRDEFLSVASHELKTPLSALLLQVQSLLRSVRPDDTAPRLKMRLEKAVTAGQRLDRLLNQMLDVSRITSGRLELEPERLALDELVKEVVDRYNEDAEISVRVQPGIFGIWDRTRLDQVMTNLMSNAVKYGKGRPIEVSLQIDGGEVVLRVTDHGIGIDPENQRRIFERFERAVATREYSGVGLGLWITRQIVEASGGSISVDSEPGKGATFTVRLPVQNVGVAVAGGE